MANTDPASSVDEVACPACGATIRARMSDAQPAAPVAAPTEPTLDDRLTNYLAARGSELSAICLIGQADYVLEEAQELVDAAEANDRQLARAEVADCAHALIATARHLGVSVEQCMDEKLELDRGRGGARPVARPASAPTLPLSDPDIERGREVWEHMHVSAPEPVSPPAVPTGAAPWLCDQNGTVRSGLWHHGTDYKCTGSAHYNGVEVRCGNPIHQRPAAPTGEAQR